MLSNVSALLLRCFCGVLIACLVACTGLPHENSTTGNKQNDTLPNCALPDTMPVNLLYFKHFFCLGYYADICSVWDSIIGNNESAIMQASSSVSIVVHANNKTLNCQLEPLYSNSPNAQILKDKILPKTVLGGYLTEYAIPFNCQYETENIIVVTFIGTGKYKPYLHLISYSKKDWSIVDHKVMCSVYFDGGAGETRNTTFSKENKFVTTVGEFNDPNNVYCYAQKHYYQINDMGKFILTANTKKISDTL